MLKYLRIASHISFKGNPHRKAWIAAVGIRSDGTQVSSFNGSVTNTRRKDSDIDLMRNHAEARLVRKLDHGAVVYVARTRRDNGKIAIAKPCTRCMMALKHRGVSQCFYTISEHEWGCIQF